MAKTVLVVDDTLTIRNLAQFALSKGSYNVLTAEDGKVGLETLSRNHVDLVITDIHMPNMDGLTMVKHIREGSNQKDVPIFALTTESTQDVVQKGRALKIMAWIVKPFEPEKLLGAVKKVLGE